MVDVGLFGPGSITWRVHADPLVGVAGLRALLLQALHPFTADPLGGNGNPARRRDLWTRLRATTDYVAVTTFGSTSDALTAAARARAVHPMLALADQPARDSDGAHHLDEAVLLWLHCCLVDSLLDVVRRGGLPLGPRDADGYVAEQVRAAALVGLEPDVVPSTTAALAEHLQRTRRDLAVTPAAREAAGSVVAPPLQLAMAVATSTRPAWAGVAGLAFATLPAWARRMYALPELPGAAGLTDTTATLALRALRGATNRFAPPGGADGSSGRAGE